MKRCKICGGKLVYAALQNIGRVSTYECIPCNRTVDIPFKAKNNKVYDPLKKQRALAEWYVKKIGGWKKAREALDLIKDIEDENDEEED